MIEKFDKTNLRALRNLLNEALPLVADELEITLDVGSMRYSDNEATIKLTARTIGEDGESYDPLVGDFKQYCGLFGFEAGDLGKVFTVNGKRFAISGLKPNNRKYPIIATFDGKSYKFEAEKVLRAIGRTPDWMK